ncbi:hypothetical protein ACQY0O_003955 [Thecaphora frezii]
MGHSQSKENVDPQRRVEQQGGPSSVPRAAESQAASTSASASSLGRRKRLRSPSSSDGGEASCLAGNHGEQGPSPRSRRRRRLSWRSSLGMPKATRLSRVEDGHAQQHYDAMQVDNNDGGYREAAGRAAQREGRDTAKGKQRETDPPGTDGSGSSRSAPSSFTNTEAHPLIGSRDDPAAATATAIGSSSSRAASPGESVRRQPQREAPQALSDDPFRHLWEALQPPASTASDDRLATGAAAAAAEEEDPMGARTPPPHLDALAEERARARRSIDEALGRQSPVAAAAAPQGAGDDNSRPAPPSTLSALLGDMLGVREETGAGAGAGAGMPLGSGSAAHGRSEATRAHPASTNGLGGAAPPPFQSQPQPQPQQQQQQQPRPPPVHNMMSGTSVIVQGALIARTLPSRRTRPQRAPQPVATGADTRTAGSSGAPGSESEASQEQQPRPEGEDGPVEQSTGPQQQQHWRDEQGQQGQQMPRATRRASEPGHPAGLRMGAAGAGEEPQAATLEEQAAMLSRILGIATAATAASLVNPTSSHAADRALLQSTLQPAVESLDGRSRLRRRRFLGRAGSSGDADSGDQGVASGASGLGQGLRDRLLSLSQRARSLSGAPATGSLAPRAGAPPTPPPPPMLPLHDGAGSLAENQSAAAELADRMRRANDNHEASSEPFPSTHDDGAPMQPAATHDLASLSPSAASTSASAWSRLLRETARHIMSSARASRTGSNASARGEADADRSSDRQSGDGVEHAEPRSHSDSQDRDLSSGSRRRREPLPDGHSMGPNDIEGPLRLVREGRPVPQGEPGSFGNFLYHLLADLSAAVESIRPPGYEHDDVQTTDYFERAAEDETTDGAEVLDGEADPAQHDQQRQQQRESRPDDRQRSTEAGDGHASGATAVDEEVRARRARDVQGGQLSFFRLFRFEPVAPSTLIPCVVVGVRSLGITETLHGEAGIAPPGSAGVGAGGRRGGGAFGRMATSRPTTLGRDPEQQTPTAARPSNGSGGGGEVAARNGGRSQSNDDGGEDDDGDGLAPASRFLLFVSGGRYPENHPLLTANPSAAGRDLMILLELLGMMSAMQNKPSTVTQRDIDGSDLKKIKASQIATLLAEGKVKENTAERCLVCLEDWTDDDECRLLACQHVFHTSCVDRWLTSSSNTCPMCRRQGVSKDGTAAGDETAESRSASAGAVSATTVADETSGPPL